MILVTLECTSATGKILRLYHPQYDYLTKNSDLLTKANLTNKVIDISPPISKMSQKTVKQFLSTFNMHIYTSGKVLSTESGRAPKAYILIEGSVMSYKRVIDFQSNKYDEKDEDRKFIL